MVFVPLECKSIVAREGLNTMPVIAMLELGGFLEISDVYMEKVAIGLGGPEGVVDLGNSHYKNLSQLADVKNYQTHDLIAGLFDSSCQSKLIAVICEAGAHIRIILDGDVSDIIQATEMEGDVDMYTSNGSASQGILAGAGLRGFGGQMQVRLILWNVEDAEELREIGIKDANYKYSINKVATGNITSATSGSTYGAMLHGFKTLVNAAVTHSKVTRSETGTLRHIKAHHDFVRRGVNG